MNAKDLQEKKLPFNIESLIKRLSSKSRIIVLIFLSVSENSDPKTIKDLYDETILKIRLKEDANIFEEIYTKTSRDSIQKTINKALPSTNISKKSEFYSVLIEEWDEFQKNYFPKEKLKGKINNKIFNCNWDYILIFGIIAFLIGYIIYLGWVNIPNVNIEINIGEIIGGILIGSGALFAGRAYAKRSKGNSPDGKN